MPFSFGPPISPTLDLRVYNAGTGNPCSIDSTSIELIAQPGYTYLVELFDSNTGLWSVVDQTHCTQAGALLTCAVTSLPHGVYQWRVTPADPLGCEGEPVLTSTLIAVAADTWDGTGTYIDSGAGINNQWSIEAICPNIWNNGWTRGTTIGLPFDLCFAPPAPQACGTANGQSWITMTRSWHLTAPATLALVDSNSTDNVHLDIFEQGHEAPPGPPGNLGSLVSRQNCLAGQDDGYGCVSSSYDNLATFSLTPGCYTLRVTIVDGTGGTCVGADIDLVQR